MKAVGLPFESLNARFLEPWEVARTFVPPPHFEEIVRKRHTVLVGPRGSGKTTQLKMLQPAALEAWQGHDAARFRNTIDYTGVFVPYDRDWQAQVTNLGAGLLDDTSRQVLGTAAFTTHALAALVDAMRYRVERPSRQHLVPHRRLLVTKEAEARFAAAVSEAWLLLPGVPSLSGLATQLAVRLSSIGRLANAEALRPTLERRQRLADTAFLHLDMLTAVVAAVQAFEETFGEHGARWALLFDELELAPEGIRLALLNSLRSADQRILLKLSLSVFAPDIRHTTSTPRNDMDVIPLWYPRKEDSFPFCQSLLSSLLAAKGFASLELDPVRVLGRSEFDPPPARSRGRAYAKGSSLQSVYKELADQDPTFAAYVRRRGIDLDAMERLPESVRADHVRKMRDIVIARVAFRKSAGDRVGHRSRKNPLTYTGSSALFAVSEGNPRQFIGIMDRLLQGWRPDLGAVPRAEQGAEIQRAVALFRAFLRTIPCPPFRGAKPARGVLSLIRHIGLSFQREILGSAFNPEPTGSFIVDSWVSEGTEQALRDALDAGAIIYVPDDAGETILESLRGKRFRLSYLLATEYKLPLTLLRPVALHPLVPRAREVRGASCTGRSLLGERGGREVRRFARFEEWPSGERPGAPPIDALVCALGFESRARFAASHILDGTEPARRLALGFASRHVLAYEANLQYFLSHGFEVLAHDDQDFEAAWRHWLAALESSAARPLRLCVDISSFSRLRTAVIVATLLASTE